MMKTTVALLASFLFLAPPSAVFSQTVPVKIDGLSEPPEMTGEPKKIGKASEADRQFFEIIGHLKDEDETKSTLPKLNEFIAQYPDYSGAYFVRATCQACILNSREFSSISNDVKSAMSQSGETVYNRTDYYSLLGKIALETAQYGRAVDDLEIAMMRDLGSATRMFNPTFPF